MGVFCLWCIVTYVLVAAYGFVLAKMTEGGLFDNLAQGIPTSVGLLVLGVALAWVPASKTPKNQTKAGLAALKEATQPAAPATTAPTPTGPNAAQPDMPALPPKKVLTKEQKDAQLGSFLSQMPPEALQLISNFLEQYNKETKRPTKPVRDFHGAENSPVLITDFTDARCGHCAQFVASLADFEYAAPAEAFRVEARHFPIDGTCNPAIPNKSEDALGCYAAKAQICMEGHPKAFDFTKLIFQNQQQLSKEAIQMIAKELAPGVNLTKCVADAATKAKLETDIQYALEHDIEGTPMILVNGQKAGSFAPFLFSLIMAEGDGKHKAFAGLPPPKAPEAAPHGHHGRKQDGHKH
jgi:serine/threonine-protein kinase